MAAESAGSAVVEVAIGAVEVGVFAAGAALVGLSAAQPEAMNNAIKMTKRCMMSPSIQQVTLPADLGTVSPCAE
jgi:hypothetical protein